MKGWRENKKLSTHMLIKKERERETWRGKKQVFIHMLIRKEK